LSAGDALTVEDDEGRWRVFERWSEFIVLTVLIVLFSPVALFRVQGSWFRVEYRASLDATRISLSGGKGSLTLSKRKVSEVSDVSCVAFHAFKVSETCPNVSEGK
jgi:hypothetical protein